MLAALVRALLWLLAAAAALLRALRRRPAPAPLAPSAPPPHVALLLPAAGYRGLQPLARLLLWSLAAGVQTFTFYDPTGALKKNEDKLIRAVEDMKVNTPGDIKWNSRPNKNGYKNGTNRKISVNIMSKEDGKGRFISVVRDMCREDKIHPSSVSAESVDSRMQDEYSSIPEPNLAIYCDEQCCTNGFLPWHIRLTEFLSLGDLETVKLEHFTELLHKYRKCEQRFGK